MKAGTSFVFVFLLSGIIISAVVMVRGCQDSYRGHEIKAAADRQKEILATETALQAEASRMRELSRQKTGNIEIRQATALFDAGQYRAAYEKVVSAVDNGGRGTEPENVKALATLLSRKDFSRVIILGNRLRNGSSEQSSSPGISLDLGKLLLGKNESGWRFYYPLFEILAMRAQGNIEAAAVLAKRESLNQNELKMWPSPLLLYFGGELEMEELTNLLNGNSGPQAETEGVLALDQHFRGVSDSQNVRRLENAAKGMGMIDTKKWEVGSLVLRPLCYELSKTKNTGKSR